MKTNHSPAQASPSKIRLLPPSVAERIAAGEVIERPSSVVKELIENSLDAGATEIVISLKEGGKDLIEIIDNGQGMSPDDLELCIERHATSKLNGLEDLEKILTLGFRGEALASISAVSDVTLISRHKDYADTYEVQAGDFVSRVQKLPGTQTKAHKITHGHFLHSPHGTKIQARSLFSQIPARLKFLRSQTAEVSQVRDCMEKLALAHPHVGFHLISQDRTLFHVRPQDEASRIRTILSDGEDYPLQIASHDQDGFRDLGLQMKLYWLQGMSSPQTRKLVQIVNSRVIRDRVLQQAILNPFRQVLLPGHFPTLLLNLKINPAAIDVNVHPTKTEIRFLESRKIFQSIENLVHSLIKEKGAPAIAPRSLDYTWKVEESHPLPQDHSENHQPYSISSHSHQQQELSPSKENQQSFPTQSYYLPAPLYGARYVGTFFQTYLAYEQQSEMILIDQHAADERIRYEKIQKRILDNQNEDFQSQVLLIPEVAKFPSDLRPLLDDRVTWLNQLGFETELFGEDSLIFRAIPAEWGSHQLKVRLKNLVDRVLSIEICDSESHPHQTLSDLLPTLRIDEPVFEKLASEACHSSVRAGDILNLVEAQNLVRQLFQCKQPWSCPHGRPTLVKVQKGKIEEWFQRNS